MAKSNSQQSIRRFYAQGNQANRFGARRKTREKVVWGTLEKLGAETRSDKNRLMEARRFARIRSYEAFTFLASTEYTIYF